MKEWRFWLAENRSTLAAFAIFIAMFWIYVSNHPAGFTANVVTDRGQQGRAARARRDGANDGRDHGGHRSLRRHDLRAVQLPGLAISGGRRVHTGVGVVLVLAAGAACGAVNGAARDLRPAAADRRHDRDRRDLFRIGALDAPRSRRRRQFQFRLRRPVHRQTVGQDSGEPGDARRRGARGLVSLQPVGDRPHGLRGRLVGIVGLYVGSAGSGREIPRLCAGGPAGRDWRRSS